MAFTGRGWAITRGVHGTIEGVFIFFKDFFFFIWTIFKVFMEFVAILLLFYVLIFFWPRGVWDLNKESNSHLLYWEAKF